MLYMEPLKTKQGVNKLTASYERNIAIWTT